MPPPSHGRRPPQRKDKRSISRSRSRSRSGYRKKQAPKQKYSQARYRSRTRSRSRSRTPKKHLPPRDRKYEKYSKHDRRSLTPPRQRHANRGKPESSRGKPAARKASYRSPSRSYSRSLSRSRSRSPVPGYAKNRKRSNFSPSGDSRSSRSPRRGPSVRYDKATDSYTTSSQYNRHSPQPGVSGKHGNYSDMDMRTQRYGVTSTDASYSAPAPEPKTLLTDRFKDDTVPPVRVEENITIGIHRKLSSRAHVSNIVIREFNAMTDFKMLRRSGEGRRPLFDREEVKKFRWDDKLDDEVLPVEERRVITVAGSSKQDSGPVFTRTSRSPPRDMDYRRDNLWNDFDERGGTSRRLVATDDFRRSEEDFGRRDFDKRRVQPEVRLDPRPDPRYEHMYRQHEYEEKAQQLGDVKLDKIHRNPNDLRHNLIKKHERQPDEGESSKYPSAKGRTGVKDSSRGRMSRSPGRYSLSPDRSRNHPRSRSRSRGRSPGIRRSSDRGQDKYRGDRFKGGKNVTPSKNRDDMTWKERVDLANKGVREFIPSPRGRTISPRGRGFNRGGFGRGGFKPGDHDDRTDVDYQVRGVNSGGRGSYSFRSRGRPGRVFRGGFRGRGGFSDRGSVRGGFRGRSGFFKSGSAPHGTWKHDMFDKLERDDDQKPSSTTEK